MVRLGYEVFEQVLNKDRLGGYTKELIYCFTSSGKMAELMEITDPRTNKIINGVLLYTRDNLSLNNIVVVDGISYLIIKKAKSTSNYTYTLIME